MTRVALAVLCVAGAAGMTQEVDMLPDTMLGSDRYTIEEARSEHEHLVNLAKEAAEMYGLDEDIFLALVQQESSWNPNAENPHSGCLGLCQLNPRFYSPTEAELLVPETNLLLGAETLAKGLRVWGGSYFMALVTYNFGIGNVLRCRKEHGAKWIGKLPDETELYVYRILPRGRWGDWKE